MRKFPLIAATLAAPLLMGFEAGPAWDQIQGEWAVGSADNCGQVHSVEFTFDYRRNDDGSLVYTNDQPPQRRDRLATTYENGVSGPRTSVGRRVTVADQEHVLYLDMRRASFWPFNDFDGVIFEIVDDNTIRELSVDDDGEDLMRALGESPVTLVRCE